MNQKWTALLLTTAMLATGASAALAYETLQPGSNGQEVLDARMRLYELGYFKKQPTQTEYTENMKKYVQQFEKDYGLTEDGILSPADQEVLFGGTQGASETVSQTSTFEPIVISDQLQIDGIFVNVFDQRMGNLGQSGFGITHGSGTVAVHRTEVALPVDHRHPH